MLSYRHAYHAGNHADVLKHAIFLLTLDYLRQKEKPFCAIDTHAGAGMYALSTGYATQLQEYKTGIARLFDPDFAVPNETPSMLQAYLQLVADYNQTQAWQFYPGSPEIARAILRPQDRLAAFELHPSDFDLLEQHLDSHAPDRRRMRCEQADGFAKLKAVLPPAEKRGVILIDPPYEDKADYERVLQAVKDGLRRFATGSFLIWYPILQRGEPEWMRQQLLTLAPNWLDARLCVREPGQDGFGMHGSGMFVINPPWLLPEQMKVILPYLKKRLGLDSSASWELAYDIQ